MNADPNLGVIVLDTQTGQQWPVWVEVDQYTQEAGLLPAGAVGSVQHDLVVHPARNLTDGHRYIVALRHLHLDNGSVARPSPSFLAYRDGRAPAGDPRTAHMAGIFRTLAAAGWARDDILLAWDFTTASTKNVTGRLVSIRDDAFAQLGASPADLAAGRVTGKAPAFTVQSVTNYTRTQNLDVARRITGTFTVPCYIAPTCSLPVKCDTITGGLVNDCPTPGQFALDPTNPDADPHQVAGQTYQANFICNVGRTNFEQHLLLRPVEYGHGLFGGAGEVNASPQQEMAGRYGMMYCATDWFGFASADIPNAVLAITDVSRFPVLTDRAQQGELDFLYLARLMIHPHGFGANPAFQFPGGGSFIDTRTAFYDGNSQGGIFGGTVCAVSVDVRRCALGVPGMDYSVLLPRSSDYVATKPLSAFDPTTFDPTNPTGEVGYSNLLDTAYPDQSQRMLILDLIQTLWDRSDPDGYATHLTAGLAHTPSHRVLLQMAWGDHQVANITAEDEARTIGARSVGPAVVAGRLGPYAASSPYWGIPAIASFPYAGSAITTFDGGPPGASPYGTDPPPPNDVPNRSGNDPHEAPRRTCAAQDQKDVFLAVNGVVTAPPPGAPYRSGGWQGSCALP
jgi:hypothetical protein